MNAHGVDGQQGWRKLFLDPHVPWPPAMDHIQVNAEMQHDQTPTQLGWSLSDTKIVLIKDARAE